MPDAAHDPTPGDADKRSHTGSLGAGAESAAGMQGAQNPSDSPHAADELPTGRGTEAGAAEEGGAERAGSEPLSHDREHTPSYGGLGGKPRISSDQREPLGENPSPS